MTKDQIVTWIKTEFKPLTLATPDPTIQQAVDNSIRYWNTNSGYKIFEMYDYAGGQARVQVSAQFKTVVQVYPATTTTWIWQDHPLWTLLGITILDNVTSDLIMMSEAFRNYRVYVGTDFRWTYVKSDDPAVGGYLYIINIPVECERVCAVGTKRILPDEDIKSEYILDWILRFTKAQVKMIEGNTLRKSDIIGVRNDGQQLFDEGKDEQTELQEKLAKDGRWVALAQRF